MGEGRGRGEGKVPRMRKGGRLDAYREGIPSYRRRALRGF